MWLKWINNNGEMNYLTVFLQEFSRSEAHTLRRVHHTKIITSGKPQFVKGHYLNFISYGCAPQQFFFSFYELSLRLLIGQRKINAYSVAHTSTVEDHLVLMVSVTGTAPRMIALCVRISRFFSVWSNSTTVTSKQLTRTQNNPHFS